MGWWHSSKTHTHLGTHAVSSGLGIPSTSRQHEVPSAEPFVRPLVRSAPSIGLVDYYHDDEEGEEESGEMVCVCVCVRACVQEDLVNITYCTCTHTHTHTHTHPHTHKHTHTNKQTHRIQHC